MQYDKSGTKEGSQLRVTFVRVFCYREDPVVNELYI